MHALHHLVLLLATAGSIHAFPFSPRHEDILLRSTEQADEQFRASCKSSKQTQICDASVIYDCKSSKHKDDCADRGCCEYTQKAGDDRSAQGQHHVNREEGEMLKEQKADIEKALTGDIKSKARKNGQEEGSLLIAVQAANDIDKADEEAEKKIDAMEVQPEVIRKLRRGHQENDNDRGDHSANKPNKSNAETLPITSEMAKKGGYSDHDMAIFIRLESQCVNENMTTVCGIDDKAVIDCRTLDVREWCTFACHLVAANRSTGKQGEAFCSEDDAADARRENSISQPKKQKTSLPITASVARTPQLTESALKLRRADKNNSTTTVRVPGQGQWRNTAMPADTPKTNRMAYLKNMHKDELEDYRVVERRCSSERVISVCMGKGVIDCETLNVIEICANNEECREFKPRGASGFGEATCVAATKQTGQGKTGSSKIPSAGMLAKTTTTRISDNAMRPIDVPKQSDAPKLLKRTDTPIAAQKGLTEHHHPNTLSEPISMERRCKKNNMASRR